MKNSMNLKPISLLVLLASCLGYSSAAPFPPEGLRTTWNQPGVESVPLRIFGDEYYARTETEDGYTAFYNQAEGRYYYAMLSADGGSLISSTIPLPNAAPAGLAKHLELSPAKIAEISQQTRAKTDGDRAQSWSERVKAYQALQTANATADSRSINAAKARVKAAAVLGKKVGLTILIQFPDDGQTSSRDPVTFPANRGKIERFCNGVGYTEDGNTGSVRDYFFDQSLGRLTYTQNVTNIVTMPRARNYYNFEDFPANTKPRSDAGETGRMLLKDALTILKAQNFDFTTLSLDSNRRAIATNIFFAGQDSGVFARGLWPHASRLSSDVNVGTAANPIYISRYQITNIEDSSPTIGTFCHENGHLLLGFPDIYSLSGEGVGRHCLMGSGNHLNSGRTPSPLNLYFKEVVGWTTITDLPPDVSSTFSLPTTGSVGYRIRRQGIPTENFIVENRGVGDKWAQFSNDKGIIVWHIDETIDGNFRPNSQYGVAVVQADGRLDLEKGANRGDNGDYFDLSDNSELSNTTTPNANWFDGTASFFKLKVLTRVGASTDVKFGSLPSDTIAVSNPNGGETLYSVTNFSLLWEASIVGNVKIELYKDGVFDSIITNDTPNDGVYDWNIIQSKKLGKGFTIRVSSLTNTLAVSDDSDRSFAITDASFPAGNSLPRGWFKPKGSKNGWKISKSTAFEGTTCLVAGATTDGKSSAIAYRSHFKAGNVSFYLKVSSEKNYDFARFYIDGVAQVFTAADSKPGISGAVGWLYASFPVSAGRHTLKWTYEKDDSYAGLKDSAWLDGVSLPQTSQEIAILDPEGNNVENGQYVASFPPTISGANSAPLTFTIKNIGKANLEKLKVTLQGVNATDFNVSGLAKAVIAPGKSITFNVGFAPKIINLHQAVVVVRSNDDDENPFSIAVQGNGIDAPLIGLRLTNETQLTDNGPPMNFGRRLIHSNGATRSFAIVNTAHSLTSVEVVGGTKFLTLTIAKPTNGSLPGTVQVSPNLLDWYSGSQHTTVITDDATTLKVRDNSPTTPDAKRYIRFK